MGWWSKVKDVAKSAASVVKKTVQTVVPGGSKGFLEPTPAPKQEAGVPSFTREEASKTPTPAGSKIVEPDTSPAQAIKGEGVTTQKEATVPFTQVIDGKEETKIVTESQRDFLQGNAPSIDEIISPMTGDPNQPTFADQPEWIKTMQRALLIQATTTPLLGGAEGIYRTKQGLTIADDGLSFGANVATRGRAITFIKDVASKFKSPAFAMTMIVGAVTSSLGGKIFGGFLGQEEANQALSFQLERALSEGDVESYDEFKGLRDELLADNSLWDTIKSYIPILNVQQGLDDYRAAAIAGGTIQDRRAENERTKLETGQSDSDYWTERAAEQAKEDRAVIDYYNDERKKQLQWEEEAANNDRDADAKFWREERAKQRVKEAEDRQAIADFWNAYKKQAQKAAENSRPSNLNFGLF